MNVFRLSWLAILYLAVGISAAILLVILLLVIRFVFLHGRKRQKAGTYGVHSSDGIHSERCGQRRKPKE